MSIIPKIVKLPPYTEQKYRLIACLIICIILLLLEIKTNFKCHGDSGGDIRYCYFPMAASLIDGDPNTTYNTSYLYGRGIVLPFVYAVTWKSIHPFKQFQIDKDINQLYTLVYILSPLFVIFALFILLYSILKIRNTVAFFIALLFYLEIDPFYEMLNNGYLDCLYLLLIAICLYLLVQLVRTFKFKYSILLGILWFVLPMLRANGLFIIMCTVLVLVGSGILHYREKEYFKQLIKNVLLLIGTFALVNVAYEVYIYLINWQPNPNVVKHFPLHPESVSSISKNPITIMPEFKSWTDFWTLLIHYLKLFPELINQVSLFASLSQKEHCIDTWLHVHANLWRYWQVQLLLFVAHLNLLRYQLKEKSKAIIIVYLAAACNFLIQIIADYNIRYYVFVYFTIFFPVIWTVDHYLIQPIYKNLPRYS